MRNSIIFVLVIIHTFVVAQPFQITFTGSASSNMVTSVEVQNLTQGTTLTVAGTDILELVSTIGISDASVIKNEILIYPNPMEDACSIEFYNQQHGDVRIELFDAMGKLLLQKDDHLLAGDHSYRLGGLQSGAYALKVITGAGSYSGVIISTGRSKGITFLEYSKGNSHNFHQAKLTASTGIIQMQYNAGDMLMFKGISGIYSRVITLLPTHNQNIDFGFVDCTDGDGNHYPVVMIGNQIWMAENLKTTKYSNGTAIPLVTDNVSWAALSSPAYCWYDNDSITHGTAYGALYNWFAVETGNLCPTGWHVPTDAEWTMLIDFLGGDSVASEQLKETGTTHWWGSNTNATNFSGFTALPGGGRDYNNGGFYLIGRSSSWWSSTAYSNTHALNRFMLFNNNFIAVWNYHKNYGYSVRCVRDN